MLSNSMRRKRSGEHQMDYANANRLKIEQPDLLTFTHVNSEMNFAATMPVSIQPDIPRRSWWKTDAVVLILCSAGILIFYGAFGVLQERM